MKNLQTLTSELSANKMQLLVPNDMLNVRGGHHKGGSKRRSQQCSSPNNGNGTAVLIGVGVVVVGATAAAVGGFLKHRNRPNPGHGC